MSRIVAPRSDAMRLAAYYLARFTRDGRVPEQLGVSSWRDAYRLFFPVAGDGREFQRFASSMDNARWAMNANFENGGRIWQDAKGHAPGLRGRYAELARELNSESDAEIEDRIISIFGISLGRTARPHTVSAEEALSELGGVPHNEEEQSWAEGDVRIVQHLKLERVRNSQAVKSKREAVRLAHDGRLACEHCDIDWYEHYGPEVVEGIFDIHHTIPLSQMDEGHETVIGDLLCLCANCHRIEHRRMALG